ncbi:MAG TPA: hypothetical protein VK184_20375 [Nostocaceae cyanobacterium]|nr:hypothetical protein [Nostocaceae cyanobacterium]
MDCKIFYSWQSDLPNNTNRSFIGDALKAAAKSIHNDDSIEIEPVIDRDTQGVPGSPDIANTIFGKIEQAQVFVCDISIINQNSPSRLTPNPNVLLELGYALKTLGWENVIMVMNTAFGKPEVLPFDLKMRRVTTYNITEKSEEKAPERKKLQKSLEDALRSILTRIEVQKANDIIKQPSVAEQTRKAIENSQQNQTFLIRQFMTWLRDEIDKLKPDFSKYLSDDLLIHSIGQTKELVIEFSRLAEIISTTNNINAARELYKQFGIILERYNIPRNSRGSYYEEDFDFYKFIGHELFVIFFSFLIRDECWVIVADILSDEIYIDNSEVNREPGLVSFTYASRFNIKLLEVRKQRLQLNRISLHADILEERHSKGEIAKIVPMQQFMDADCFLFLRSECENPNANSWDKWIPWSKIYMNQIPSYLLKAYKAKYAEQLLPALGVKDIASFRRLLPNANKNLEKMFAYPWPSSPLSNFKVLEFGSK